jgi:hypothetical protein
MKNQLRAKAIVKIIRKRTSRLALSLLESRSKQEPEPETQGYSSLDEDKLIQKYLRKTPHQKSCVDIAASDGTSASNTRALFEKSWEGLAVEFDGEKFAKLAASYASFPGARLSRNKISPDNVIPLLQAHGVPKNFGFLSLDIDSFDYFVLAKILSQFRPALICAEINEKIPPPLEFTVKYIPDHWWSGDHFYGQSICQLHTLTSRHNYDIVELHYNNAFLIPSELNVFKSLTPEAAFRRGYVNKKDREIKFPWNKDADFLLTMSPVDARKSVNRMFKKYKGKYELV